MLTIARLPRFYNKFCLQSGRSTADAERAADCKLAAVAYPSVEGAYNDQAVRLAPLVSEINSEDNWTQGLSGGEQQRLAIARAILDKPDWLFLDEATSALDEKLEAEIYRMLSEVLPDATIASIGHRTTLIALHRRHIEMEPGEGGIFEPTPRMGVASFASAQP